MRPDPDLSKDNTEEAEAVDTPAPHRTIRGVPVTQEQILTWADEAEAGYDPSFLRSQGRPAS